MGPMTPTEVRQQARILLDAAERGDVDAAHVLLDVLPMLPDDHHASVALSTEALAQALRGRTHPAGDKLPDAASRARNLRYVLARFRDWVFPPRRSPCMPNRAALRELFEAAQSKMGSRSEFSKLWARLQNACDVTSRRNIDGAMGYANDVLDGHGVELLRVRTRRGGTGRALYINMGDTYNPTLVWNLRFIVTTYADAERRFGQTEEAPDPYDA